MQYKDRPWLIDHMKPLMMTVGELSARLERLATNNSQLSFISHAESKFVSNEYDVRVSAVGSGLSIDIAEPACGQPLLSATHDPNDPRCQEADWLIQTMVTRRDMLSRVMRALAENHPGSPVPQHSVRFQTIADACNLHITTVSRTLDNKICSTPNGPMPCRDYIYGLK